MDSAEFLDILGNANRRRILRLLARKPCYVTEISEILGVSPKAVIDHLQQLEDAGLVESRTDDRRRKYFSISQHVRLEVTVSPYEFGTKSAYPSNSRIDITSCRRLSVELEAGEADGADEASADGTVADAVDEPVADGAAADGADESVADRAHDGGSTSASAESGAASGAERDDAGAPTPVADGAEAEAGESAGPAPSSDGTPQSGSKPQSSAGPPSAGRETAERGEDAVADSDASSAEPGKPRNPSNRRGHQRVALKARRLRELEQLDRELSMAQRWTQGRITQLKTDIAEAIGLGNPGLVTDLLLLLADEPRETAALCRHLEAPPAVVDEVLEVLADDGLLERNGGQWHLAD